MSSPLRAVPLAAAVLLAVSTLPPTAQAQAPIKIGEINSYTGLTAFTVPYRKGAELAIEEINAKGGVNGRKLEAFFRHDGFRPADAVRHAGELLSNENAEPLAGALASNTG